MQEPQPVTVGEDAEHLVTRLANQERNRITEPHD